MKKTEPIYIQLMNNIKHKITSGEYRVGDKIMSEREMANLYKINRLTVRNSIKRLIDEGILVAIQGRGTYVYSVPEENKKFTLGLKNQVSLSSSLKQSGFNSSREVLAFEKIKIPKGISEYFSNTKEVYELIRLSKINDEPYVLQICYFPANKFTQPERFDFGKGSLYTYMDTQGHMPKVITSTMETKEIPNEYIDIMNCKEKTIIFYYEYFGYDKEEALVEYTKSYYMPKYTKFKYVCNTKK